MKKVLSLVLVAIFLSAVTGCTSTTADPTAVGTSSAGASAMDTPEDSGEFDYSGISVAGVMHTEDQFAHLVLAGEKKAADEVGAKFYSGISNFNQAKEMELLNTWETAGVVGYAVCPVGASESVDFLSKMSERGAYIGLANGLEEELPFTVANYSANHSGLGRTAGEYAAKYIKENLGGKAVVGVLGIVEGNEVSARREQGFINALKDSGVEYELAMTQYGYKQDIAMQLVTDMLTARPDINIIYTSGEGGTLGACVAIRNSGKAGSCWVFGNDISTQMIQELKSEDGILACTVGENAYSCGYEVMRKVLTAISGGDVSETKGGVQYIGLDLIARGDQEMIDKYEGLFAELE